MQKTFSIAPMTRDHKQAVLEMMRVFYRSPAVHTDGSEEIFQADVEACVSDDPYLKGYVFLEGETPVGYAMTALSFSTEYGRHCVWIEDLYLQPEYRGSGLGSRLFRMLEELHPGAILRLEVEAENTRAVKVYEKNGFDSMPYQEMKKLL